MRAVETNEWRNAVNCLRGCSGNPTQAVTRGYHNIPKTSSSVVYQRPRNDGFSWDCCLIKEKSRKADHTHNQRHQNLYSTPRVCYARPGERNNCNGAGNDDEEISTTHAILDSSSTRDLNSQPVHAFHLGFEVVLGNFEP